MNRSVLYIFLTLLPIFQTCYSNAQQNLVPNPSFEEYTACPVVGGLDSFINDWYSSYGSCDYYNICNTTDNGIPINIVGDQEAHSGNAYVGAYVFFTLGNTYSEYFQTKLVNTLKYGQEYCVVLHVSLADRCQYASDCIGVYFSSVPETGVLFSTVGVESSISNDFIINDTLGWVEIKGKYIGKGIENYITIGCFKEYQDVSFQETNSLPFSSLSYSSYYYFDDVFVGICDPEIEVPNIITPNGDGLNDFLVIKTDNEMTDEKATIYIYNRWGQELFYTNQAFLNFWDGKFLGKYVTDGVYYYMFEYNAKKKKRDDSFSKMNQNEKNSFNIKINYYQQCIICTKLG